MNFSQLGLQDALAPLRVSGVYRHPHQFKNRRFPSCLAALT